MSSLIWKMLQLSLIILRAINAVSTFRRQGGVMAVPYRIDLGIRLAIDHKLQSISVHRDFKMGRSCLGSLQRTITSLLFQRKQALVAAHFQQSWQNDQAFLHWLVQSAPHLIIPIRQLSDMSPFSSSLFFRSSSQSSVSYQLSPRSTPSSLPHLAFISESGMWEWYFGLQGHLFFHRRIGIWKYSLGEFLFL